MRYSGSSVVNFTVVRRVPDGTWAATRMAIGVRRNVDSTSSGWPTETVTHSDWHSAESTVSGDARKSSTITF